MLQVVNRSGIPFNVKVLFKGDRYGLRKCLVHDEDRPLVEFYDARYDFNPEGQFVSSYYVETILSNNSKDSGLCLDGGIPDWYIDAEAMQEVYRYLQSI